MSAMNKLDEDELIEAMKEGFAVRLADVEAKAERYRLALEKCNNLIHSGVSALTLQHTIREALK